jgi:hypothetical protein
MGRKKLRVWLDESDYLALKKTGEREGKSISELVRESIAREGVHAKKEMDSVEIGERILEKLDEKLLGFLEVLAKNFFAREQQKEQKSGAIKPEIVSFLVQKIGYMNRLLIEINDVIPPVSTAVGDKKDSVLRAKNANGAAESAMRILE